VLDSDALSRTQVSPAKLARITMRAANYHPAWLGLVQYDTSQRFYRRLELRDDYEVWLLTWLAGQQTGFHDHGASAGAFTVAMGCLSERSALAGIPAPSGRMIAQGGVRAFGPHYVHDVRNESALPAVSVHAYSPPLSSMQHYDISPGGLLQASVEVSTW
jgi:predicted metal-dependent enzyme (double-stranded beta helix superfamily)